MKKQMKKRTRQWICGVAVFCLLAACLMLWNSHMFSVLGATCPNKNHEDWNYEYVCGCSACGGNSSVAYGTWLATDGDVYRPDSRAGDGVIVEKYDTWTTENGKGETYTNVEVTYRCYNCGYRSWDGTIYNSSTYEDWNNVISFTGTDSENGKVKVSGPQSKGAGSGAVPWYHCVFCDGKNTGNYSHNTCYTITAQVSNSAGGTVSFTDTTANRVKINSNNGTSISAIAGPGASLSISVSVDDGYEFGGWSSGENSEEITITASSDKTYTAKVSLKPSPGPTKEPTAIPTEAPSTPDMVTWTYREEFYTNGSLDGYEISSSNEYYIGATIDDTVNITSRSYNGNTYRNGVLTVLGDCGISVENGNHLTGTLTGNGVALRKFYRTVDNPDPTTAPDPTTPPIEHTHNYGNWVYDDTNHWKECECGDIAEKNLHNLIAGTPDGDGTTTYTCTECGYTKVAHKHDWVGWCAYDVWDDTYDEEQYHWKICAYNSCSSASYKGKHVMGEYVDEGNGYLVARCTTCQWIMDEVAIQVSLTFHPNGGTFPDGSTNPVTIENITYGQPTTLWQLSSDFLPVKDGMEFRGWFIVTQEEEGCVYTPDFTNNVCTGTGEYFGTDSNGYHVSRLKKSYTLYAQWKKASYTVEYDGNGATEGVMYPSYHVVNEEKALNLNGYYYKNQLSYLDGGIQCTIGTTLANTTVNAEFAGWAMTPTGTPVYSDGETVCNLLDHAGTVTLYAVWDLGSVILPNATAADGGSRLSGWKTEDGNIISVLNGSGNYKEVTYYVHGDETLTAVWIPNTYTVSFDSDGGTACDPITVTYKKTYDYGNDGLPTPRKTGYLFTGWKIALTNESIGNNSIVTTAADHVLTAGWTPNNVRIELDYNFDYDTEAINPKKNSSCWSLNENTDWTVKLFDSAYGTLPEPTRDGYTFACWYLEEDENGNGCGEYDCLVSDTILITNPEKHTLHARWVKDEYRIDLDYNYDYSVWGEE